MSSDPVFLRGRSLADTIKQQARSRGQDSQDVLRRYACECMICRLLEIEGIKDSMILKGGLLWSLNKELAEHKRPTHDFDIHFFKHRSLDDIKAMFARAAGMEMNDGLRIEFGNVESLEHTHGEYEGLRVPIVAWLGNTRINIHADIGFGGTRPRFLPELPIIPMVKGLAGATVACQPSPYAAAEKIHAVVQKSMTNTRMKDYRDLSVWSSIYEVTEEWVEALATVFEDRQMEIPMDLPPGLTEEFAQLHQGDWESSMRSLGLQDKAPAQLSTAVNMIRPFVMDIFGRARANLPRP